MAKEPSPFADLSTNEIAALVERNIRDAAQAWKRKQPLKNPRSRTIETAATAAAALYLQQHHELYFRDDAQELKDMHHKWMMLMKEWFRSTVESDGGK